MTLTNEKFSLIKIQKQKIASYFINLLFSFELNSLTFKFIKTA